MCGAGDRDVKKEEDEVKHLSLGEEEAKHFLVFFASKNFWQAFEVSHPGQAKGTAEKNVETCTPHPTLKL